MREVMRSEVKTDVYGGENCDEHENYFETYSDGDKQSEDHKDDLIIKLSDLPAGSIISVQYPSCPECDLPRYDKFEHLDGGVMKIVGHEEKCECGFDWLNWIEMQYS